MPPKVKQIKQMIQSNLILPPGTEKCSDKSFGELIIKMGKVQWIQDSNPHSGNLVYRLQFWGQEGDGLLIQPINLNLQYPNELKLDIRVPIIGFHQYLCDAEKSIIYLVDNEDKFQILGYINLNYVRHLNKDLSKNQVFHNLSGQYPIYKYIQDQPDNKEYKIGYQNIEVNCKFILIQQQIELCQQLQQTNNIQQLQQIIKQQNLTITSNNKTTNPQINVIFPTENEAWLQKNPDSKLANVLFAENPFNKPQQIIESNQYEQQKYIDSQKSNQLDQSKQQINEQNINEKNNQKDDIILQSGQKTQPQQQQQQQQQQNVKFVDDMQQKMEQLFNSYHCINCCPQKQKRSDSLQNSNNKQNQQNSSDKKNNSVQKNPEPFRNPKPNSGHYNKSPTQYRYASKPENQKSNPPPFKSTRNNKPEENIPEIIQQQHQVIQPTKSTYQIQTKEVQTEQEKIQTTQQPQQPIRVTQIYDKQLESYRKLKLQLIDFHTFSDQIYNKLNAINLSNIFIDCTYKNQQKRTFFKSQGQELFNINETIEFDVFINESSFAQFQADQIKFSIQCYRRPENAEDQKYFRITLGDGYFKIIKAINEEEFYIIINTNLPFDQNNVPQSGGFQYSIVNKDQLSEYQVNKQNRLGEIRIKASFVQNQENKFIDQPVYHIYHSFNPTLLIRLGKIIGLDGIFCRFKIPGSSDFFQSSKNESIYFNYQIITPLNFDSFQRLESSPLLIEIWKENQLIGMIRIPLKSINQILINEQNEFVVNIFKNIYPLIISDDQQPIKRIRDQQQVGSIHILIAFGIPAQINKIKIENIQTKSNQEIGNQYEEIQEQQQEIFIEAAVDPIPPTFIEIYEAFQLNLVQNHNDCIIDIFKYLNKNKKIDELPKKQFINIEQLEYLNFDDKSIFVFAKIFDYKKQQSIKLEHIQRSFTAFNYFLPRISVEANKQMKRLVQYLIENGQDPLDFIGKLLLESKFGFLETQKVISKFPNFDFEFFELLLKKGESYSIQLLNELICQYIQYNYVKLEEIPESLFCYVVQNSIQQKAQKINLNEVEKMTLNIDEVQQILNACLINVSFWEVYCLFRYLKFKFQNFILQEWEIQKQLLQNWTEVKEEQKQPEQPIQKKKVIQIQDKENQVNQQLEFYVHKFQIQLKEIQNLKLNVPHGTQLQIEYRYPLCEQSIKSYPLIYSKLLQYQCPSDSTYTYIQQIEQNCKFIDVVDSVEGGIQFKLKSDEQTLAQSLLSSQEIVKWMEKSEEMNKDKTLVLMPINSKLSFSVKYSRERINQQQLSSNPELLENHNQTIQEIHLPKRVGLSVYAEVVLNEKALKFEDKLIKLDIFSVVNFNAQISKQQGNKTIIINEEKQLQVDNQLIEQFSTQQMIIQVSSNSQNLIGKCELIQTQLLKSTLEGEYALVNQYGLFTGVIKLKCQLNKYKLPLNQQQAILKEKEIENNDKRITCLLSFREIIMNIGQLLKPSNNDEFYVYFMMKHQNQTYLTIPQLVDKKKLSQQLLNSLITLEMNYYQDLNIIIYSSKKNSANQLKDIKLGEINIKFNQLTQSQIDSKLICINDYFTINCDCIISRIGIKLMLINQYDEIIPQFIKFYQNNQLHGYIKLNEIQQLIDRQLYEYLSKITINCETAFIQDQIGYHINKQNFYLSEQNLSWDLIEEIYKLSNNGFIEENKIKQLLDSFYIVNFNEKSYSLFTKPNVYDKNSYKYLNQFDSEVFLSKINLQIEIQKPNEIIIQVLRAHNLHLLNQNKSPNAIIQMLINDEIYRTPVKVKDSNPIYNYCFNTKLEYNYNIEFRVTNSGAEREILGSCFINSSELIKIHEKGSNEEIKMYIHGSKAQSYIIIKIGNEIIKNTLDVLQEVQQYKIDDINLERIRGIIGKI